MNYSDKFLSHDCKEELRQAGLKITPCRLHILAVLEAAENPLDAKAILAYLQNQNIKTDRATVFRIMNLLTKVGLVIPTQFHDGKTRYEHTTKATHHFICESCGVVIKMPECNIDQMEQDMLDNKGLLVKRHTLEFFGLCKDCQK